MSVTTAPIEIFTGQDFYVPTFQVKLRKRPLPQSVVRDVVQVTYKDSVDEIDSFELTINNWDDEKRTFKYSDSDLFNPGEAIELWMGYHGKDRQRLMLSGEVTSLRLAFPSSGTPTLSVGGLNLMHQLRDKPATHVYKEMTDSKIARVIGGRTNVTIETVASAEREEHKERYLLQDNETDAFFLMKRARLHDYELFVIEDGTNGQAGTPRLYFGPSVHLKRVTYRLSHGRTLIEFQPNLSTADQVGEVTVRGWDPTHKKKIEFTAKRADVASRMFGPCGRLRAIERSIKDRKEIVVDKAPVTEAEARRLAVQQVEDMVKGMLKATGSTVGLPDLRAGNVLEIDGLGDCFSGRYFVTGTTHSIGDGGYTTQFDCRLEALTGDRRGRA